MDVAVGVVAVPQRERHVDWLTSEIRTDVVVFDEDHHGERWCHQEVLAKLLRKDAYWLVLVEDDAVPVEGFDEKMRTALEGADQDAIVSFYLGSGPWAGMPNAEREAAIPAMHAEGEATGWIKTDMLYSAVAFAVPLSIAPLIGWCLRDTAAPTDTAIGLWTRKMQVPVWYTYPSLVDHRDDFSVVDGIEPVVERRALWL